MSDKRRCRCCSDISSALDRLCATCTWQFVRWCWERRIATRSRCGNVEIHPPGDCPTFDLNHGPTAVALDEWLSKGGRS